MSALIKINSGNLKDLSSKGVHPKTIETIEGIRETGGIIKNKSDLEKIGISKDEIKMVIPLISFAVDKPLDDLKTVNIKTDLKGKPGYILILRYQDKDTLEILEDSYLIPQTDETQINYDVKNTTNKCFFSIKAPTGEFCEIEIDKIRGKSIEVDKSEIGKNAIKVTAIEIVKNSPNAVVFPSKIKGRLLSDNPSRNTENIQIVIEAAVIDKPKDSDYSPICFATTEYGGYFFTSQIQFNNAANLKSARAKIGIIDQNPYDIRLEEKEIVSPSTSGSSSTNTKKVNTLPDNVIIYLQETNPQEIQEDNCDCGCTEIGFSNKKVLDEFSFYSVVRTTEPMIEALEISESDEIDLEDITIDDPEVSNVLKGIKLPTLEIKSILSKYGTINKTNVSKIKAYANKYQQKKKLQIEIKKTSIKVKSTINRGRIDLDGTTGVDWDEKPTVYQATTIAHGHILQFKQEWFNDGYSLGDLIYSLPLAPGQKKQIVVFDWDRKDSASNTQRLDYQDSLYNSLRRDRDVKEVATATVNENIDGDSNSDTESFSAGYGGINLAFVPGIFGVSGGNSSSNSHSEQDSERTTTSKSRQRIVDKTVQAASSVRSQRSTVIQTVSQGERFQVSSEVVVNYNHCHAMTIEYFEVLRHFEIRTRLANVQECLFIPLKISEFDFKKALRWRHILEKSLKKRSLQKGFDAMERYNDAIDKCGEGNRECIDEFYSDLGIPKKWYAERELEYIEGELYFEFQLTRPDNDKNDEFVPENWAPFSSFLIGNPLEFYNNYIRQQINKDEAFYKNAGPKIAEAVFEEIRMYAVKNASSFSRQRLPIDATLLSDFKNKKRLNVSIRMSGPMSAAIKREDIDYIEISLDNASERSEILKKLGEHLKIIIHSGSLRYRTIDRNEYLFKNSYIKNDLDLEGDDVRIFTPLNAKEMRRPRLEDVEISNSLLQHLNENLEYYHQCIWSRMDQQRRYMLLDGLVAPGRANGRSVASVVENKLTGIVGNCIVMPVAPGFQLDPTLDESIDLFKLYYEDPKDPTHISLPTKGVFAEAIMGKCNSCEKKDESRFWRWEESPIPDSPTAIGQVNVPIPNYVSPANVQGKDFPASIINLQSAPGLPDPQGYGALISLLSNPNLFRDAAGLTETQKNALAALQSSFGTTQFFGGKVADLAAEAAKIAASVAFPPAGGAIAASKLLSLDQIKKAKENGLITEGQAQQLTNEAFKSIIGNSGSTISQSVDDIAKTEKKVKDKEISKEDGEDVKKIIKQKEKSKAENEKSTLDQPEVKKAIEDADEFSHEKPSGEKTTVKRETDSKTNDLTIYVTLRNTYGRELFSTDIAGAELNFIIEGDGKTIPDKLSSSGSTFGAIIKNLKMSNGQFQLLVEESGKIPFSGKKYITLTGKSKSMFVDAQMASRPIDITFSKTESYSTAIEKKLTSILGSKLSSTTKASLAGQIEETIGAEITAQMEAGSTTSSGSSTSSSGTTSFEVLIPTGDLNLTIHV